MAFRHAVNPMTTNDHLPNVYYLAGKRRVRSIRHCDCFKKDGQCYYLRCRIGRRNCSRLNALTYEWSGGDGEPALLQAIGRCGSRYCLYPDEPARSTLRAAIELFETQAAAARSWPSVQFEADGRRLTLHYRRRAADRFDFLLAATTADGAELLTIYRDRTVGAAVAALRDLAEVPTEVLVRLPGGRVLPPLPEEFDRYYTVNADNIDRDLLRRSGYRILHRPGFAMRGNTYRKWQLNPSRRLGLDFAADNAPALDFAEFLGLFERGERARAPSNSGKNGCNEEQSSFA